MLMLPASVRIYLAAGHCDMRKGFDTLAAIVRETFGDDPLSGHLFVFRSRRGDRIKILWWDRDGFAIWMKRLERGAFRVAIPEHAARSGRVDLPRRELKALVRRIIMERDDAIRKLRLHLARRFRPRAEALDPAQLSLFAQARTSPAPPCADGCSAARSRSARWRS